MKSINAKKWNDTANKYWFVSIVINLCRDVYELAKLIDETFGRNGGKKSVENFMFGMNTVHFSIQSKRDLMDASLKAYSYIYRNRAVFIDTTKNLCDLFIPMTALGYTKLRPSTVGILGVISSIIGIMVLVQPTTKLLPT